MLWRSLFMPWMRPVCHPPFSRSSESSVLLTEIVVALHRRRREMLADRLLATACRHPFRTRYSTLSEQPQLRIIPRAKDDCLSLNIVIRERTRYQLHAITEEMLKLSRDPHPRPIATDSGFLDHGLQIANCIWSLHVQSETHSTLRLHPNAVRSLHQKKRCIVGNWVLPEIMPFLQLHTQFVSNIKSIPHRQKLDFDIGFRISLRDVQSDCLACEGLDKNSNVIQIGGDRFTISGIAKATALWGRHERKWSPTCSQSWISVNLESK